LIVTSVMMWFVVSMGFFDDIFISHERLKDPSRLYPFCSAVIYSFLFSTIFGV